VSVKRYLMARLADNHLARDMAEKTEVTERTVSEASLALYVLHKSVLARNGSRRASISTSSKSSIGFVELESDFLSIHTSSRVCVAYRFASLLLTVSQSESRCSPASSAGDAA
jgi:sulfur transfer complex TusBCD TusB component (DsrH family)